MQGGRVAAVETQGPGILAVCLAIRGSCPLSKGGAPRAVAGGQIRDRH